MDVHHLILARQRILRRLRLAIDDTHITMQSSHALVQESREIIHRARITTHRVATSAYFVAEVREARRSGDTD